MIRLNVATENGRQTYEFDNVLNAYFFVLENVATEEDFEYYKNLCGLDLREVSSLSIMEATLRNVFECILSVEKI